MNPDPQALDVIHAHPLPAYLPVLAVYTSLNGLNAMQVDEIINAKKFAFGTRARITTQSLASVWALH